MFNIVRRASLFLIFCLLFAGTGARSLWAQAASESKQSDQASPSTDTADVEGEELPEGDLAPAAVQL